VALIRDLRRHVPCTQQEEEMDEDVRKPAWWQAEWKAEPTPAAPTTARLIPIVTTADTVDAVELAQTYTRRWPVQENIIRDFLVPLGLNTNHGYGKTPIVNSEEARETSRLREAFEHCPALDRFCTSPFPQSLSALWSTLEANQDLWR
jgi:hypothetical protein